MTTQAFDAAFTKVGQLAATFKANERRYLSPDYQEAEARKDFIDKFFIALGWDVYHDVQTNPYEQEVKVEPPVSAAGQRRADYAFHIAPNFRDVTFFVEAKKPHGDIATPDNYFQTIRYGWNSQTPLAALTDFEQFHVLDCRYKPDAATALNRAVAKYHYSDYANRDKFAEIYWLFSREAVADGSLEKRAKELPKPRGKAIQRGLFPGGYQSIDESFLKELDEYRTTLARTFKHKNARLDSATLTELAQRTLDRLVFLRFLEDKGIEPQRLVDRFGEKGTAWEDFIAASRRLDGIYNGIVFKQHAILDVPSFRVDADAFARICKALAHVNSPYDFNAIPIHILGSIYERFLGKVIVATDKRVRVEEKPEVRKAGGVYYTPEYIVRYIVENTVGKLIHGKTPDQIAEMRFADIACGSGSFLLGVYDLLLQHHGNYYNANPKKARKGDCIQRDGKLYLSLRKKREILLNNIYGVDIDAQAVEVCQLSLYLKLLKDETTTSAREHQLEFHETLLPPLNKNIVCGNSLIGTDILEGQLFPSDEERKLNPMNFEDAFPHIFGRQTPKVREEAEAYSVARSIGHEGGRRVYPSPPIETRGFDAIVGNPPYLAGREWGDDLWSQRPYFKTHYSCMTDQYDLYALFIQRAVELLREGGRFGYITPNTWLNNEHYLGLREWLVTKAEVDRLGDFRDVNVFPQATVLPIVVTAIRKSSPDKQHTCAVERFTTPNQSTTVSTSVSVWEQFPSLIFNLSVSDSDVPVLKKIASAGKPLANDCDVRFGVKVYQRGKGKPHQKGPEAEQRLFEASKRKSKDYYPYLWGSHVSPWRIETGKTWLRYGPHLAEPRTFDLFTGPRILVRRIVGDRLILAPTKETLIADQLLHTVKPRTTNHDFKYYAALLSSQAITYYFRKRFNRTEKTFPEIRVAELEQLPIRRINFSDPADKAAHDQMVRLVEQMLEAKKQLAKAKTDKDKTYYERRCSDLDHQIDRLVYELYGLTEAEIAIVEGGA
ncbi:MAG: TaqI-like C-terminal specificity domain-containing protein [Verrucomicrobiia bacterium]